jgi:SnoaL-like polyketide cyclase
MLGLQEISERATHTATLRRVYDEILNEGKLELAEDLVAENAVDHAPDRTSSLPTGGPDRLQAFVATFCVAFPRCLLDDYRPG